MLQAVYVCVVVQYISPYIDTELLIIPAVTEQYNNMSLHALIKRFFNTFHFVLKIYQFYRNDSVHSHSIKGMYSYTLTIKLKQSFLILV